MAITDSPDTFFPSLVLDAPPYAPPWLLSFHAIRFLIFEFFLLVVAYPLYRTIAIHWLRWEGHPKSTAKHFNDITSTVGYSLALFIGGNYSNTLSWYHLITFLPSLFLFGWCAELPSLRHSFTTIASWRWPMYLFVLIQLSIILAIIGHHLWLAYILRVDAAGKESILGWYIVSILGIPVLLLVIGWIVSVIQNREFERLKLAKKTDHRSSTASSHRSASADPGGSSSADGLSAIENGTTIESDEMTCHHNAHAHIRPVGLHPHHWAIFYVLGFFTRWDDIISKLAAGLVIGVYMHGVIAYGHDSLLE